MAEPKTIFDTPLQNYLREHAGLPAWCLELGIQGVLEQQGWSSPEETLRMRDFIHELLTQCDRMNSEAIKLREQLNK